MTHKHRDGLERDLETLGEVDPKATESEQWAQEYIRESDTTEWNVKIEFRDGEATTRLDGSENILIAVGEAGRYYAPPEDVPAWLDTEGDLPVRL